MDIRYLAWRLTIQRVYGNTTPELPKHESQPILTRLEHTATGGRIRCHPQSRPLSVSVSTVAGKNHFITNFAAVPASIRSQEWLFWVNYLARKLAYQNFTPELCLPVAYCPQSYLTAILPKTVQQLQRTTTTPTARQFSGLKNTTQPLVIAFRPGNWSFAFERVECLVFHAVGTRPVAASTRHCAPVGGQAAFKTVHTSPSGHLRWSGITATCAKFATLP